MTLSNTSFDFLWLCLIFLTEFRHGYFKFLKEKLFQLFRQLQNNMQTNYFTNNTSVSWQLLLFKCKNLMSKAGTPVIPGAISSFFPDVELMPVKHITVYKSIDQINRILITLTDILLGSLTRSDHINRRITLVVITMFLL